MSPVRRVRLAVLASLTLSEAAHAALPRFPNAHNGTIVLVAGGNIRQVPHAGGAAQRLTSDPGQDMFSRYSCSWGWTSTGNVPPMQFPTRFSPGRKSASSTIIPPPTATFPIFFRPCGLGKLLGTRTLGGVRGIRGEWKMMDGGFVTIPEESIYGLGSQWVRENHGVDPDIELENLPGDLQAGHDKQLETAVSLLQRT
jgi:hypothetical protein